ncbi:HAMP domain-containing histidine kinase [Paenibacillus tritici]|uniref:histidine kinase n=1 Tax=Paenibacillus tritici TaxID=1873425 RepID=A0ABX2DSC4_9BACL|nr:HAMP domain-containing sensor histidine kinase [Paenibacillus tritici]NQX47577.1 HAMP domain-containing histidine kinase [Paenibacillus tritici]QUL55774.1 HAMP domain-containing histidine kinase [Paenibacillus tritici]
MKLRSTIHLYSSVLFAVLLVMMNLFIYLMFSRLSIDSQLEQAAAETARIAADMRRAGEGVAAQELLRAYVPIEGMLRLLSADGSGPAPVTSASEQEISRLKPVYYTDKQIKRIQTGGRSYAFVSIPVIWTDGNVRNVQTTKSLESTMNTLRVLRLVLAGATALVLLPLLLSSRLLAGLIMRPIVHMTATMREIRNSGKFRRLTLKETSRDELTEMGHTFNEMIALLESNHVKQEKFVSDASHELRTPLTVIESYASLLKRRGLDHPELFNESVEAIHSEAVRMKELTEQLLLLAKHHEHSDLELTMLDLEELVRASAKVFHNAYGREIIVQSKGPVEGYSDGAKLRQLLFIFLDNARKYSDEAITVSLEASGQERRIVITDQGIGIPPEELPKIFDRFYRVDEARSRAGGGAGLGLSLAAEIADAIGAKLSIDSAVGRGTSVMIEVAAKEQGGG